MGKSTNIYAAFRGAVATHPGAARHEVQEDHPKSNEASERVAVPVNSPAFFTVPAGGMRDATRSHQ